MFSPPAFLRTSILRAAGMGVLLAAMPSAQTHQKVSHNLNPLANNSALGNLVRGPEAVARLGGQLSSAAEEMGMDASEFRNELLADEGIWINERLEVVFVDPLFVDGDDDEDSTQQLRSATTIPLDQAFLLHSRPSSNYTIYLDFTGHHSVNNGWGHDIMFPPFNRSGSSNNFSNSELREIIDHWRYMAEDFALFNVDVTTEEPPLDRLTNSGSGDTTWGVRDIHTQATDGFGNGIGGVAFLRSFDNFSDRPVFSFNKGGNNGGMTGSHEVGHSLGLSHDGLNSSTYHPGSSLGSYSWGPIMGAPFGAKVVQWSLGDYAGSTTSQNDINIISSSRNGTRVLGDDHGDTIATATAISGDCPTPNQVEICSKITTRSDRDVYKFDSTGGRVSIAVSPADSVGNVDLFLELYDPAGVKLVGSDLPRNQDALIIRMISPGEHTIHVYGSGQAGLYSDYGSLGHYVLDVTFPGRTSDFTDLGNGLAGAAGVPVLVGTGYGCDDAPVSVDLSSANPSSPAFLAYSNFRVDVPLFSGILVPSIGMSGGVIAQSTDSMGQVGLSDMFPTGISMGTTFYFQYWVRDAGAPRGYAASNAVVLTVP